MRRVLAGAVPNRLKLEESFVDGKFDVRNCEIASYLDEGEFASAPPDDYAIEQLAFEAVVLERAMREAGYSEGVFRQALERYEKRRLAEIRGRVTAQPPDFQDPADIATRALVEDLNLAREKLQPATPPFSMWGECDYHGAGVIVRTAPQDGRVWMSARRSFDLCRARRADPWNRDQCGRWREIQVGQPEMLPPGEYVYDAVWPNGRRSKSMHLPIRSQRVVTIRPD
jgi:hypothetical protein